MQYGDEISEYKLEEKSCGEKNIFLLKSYFSILGQY